MARKSGSFIASCLFALALFASSARADSDRARQTFHLCTACHGAQGQGNPELKAPSIAGLPDWYVKNQLEKFRAGTRGAHRCR